MKNINMCLDMDTFSTLTHIVLTQLLFPWIKTKAYFVHEHGHN